MTFVVSDRTQDTTTSVGPTAFTISGTPVTGCQSFLSGIGVGNTTYLTITDGVFWMDVLATVTSSTLITVTQVLAGSAGFTISSNFTATGVTKQVFCTYPASKAVIQDANNTVNLNNFAPAISPITSAGATTTLTAASAHIQRITGTLAQTIKLPDQTTLPSNGIAFLIDNKATQNVTIADSAGTTLATAVPGSAILLYSTSNSTATGNWDGYAHVPASVQWGSGALGVAYGGTGVATLLGIAFGNGTGAFTAATGAQIASALGSTAISGNAAGLSATLAVGSGGTGVTTSTGSGSVVLSNSPTLVTPALGTPASGTLTNCTFPTLNQNTTGTAAGLSTTLVATSGGTGKSTTVVGDLIQGGATNTWATLAAVATGNALISGGIGAASSWGKIGLTTHISGTLAVGNGGIGVATLSGIAFGNGTSAFTAATGAQIASALGSTAISGNAAGLSAILAIASGGTNSSATPTNGGIGYGTGTAHAYSAAGTIGQSLVSAGASAPLWGSSIILGSNVASTSGTAVLFTGIPSWVKRITVLFLGVSTSGTALIQVQAGSGSVTSSGYVSAGLTSSGSGVATAGNATGFVLGANSQTAALTMYGSVVIELVSVTNYVGHGSISSGLTNQAVNGGIALPGLIDRVNITTTGSDTFDGGQITLYYE